MADGSFRSGRSASIERAEGARSPRVQDDAERVRDVWQPAVSRRWTFVDRFERNGKRYIVVIDDAPATPRLDRLSPRECAVVAHAARGLNNKDIAHELGIAHATVRVLMLRAARKLRVRGREELVGKYGRLIELALTRYLD